MKYNEWLFKWLENYIKPTTKNRTYRIYANIVKHHIYPFFSEIYIDDLKPIDLQKFITYLLNEGNKKTGEGLSANSVNQIINVIQGSLKTAYYAGICNQYIGNKIKRPKLKEIKTNCFSKQEQKILENYVFQAKTQFFGIVLTLYTGLRIGELMSLEWSDIDLENGLLKVSKSCHDGKNKNGVYGRIIDTPKTSSSIRIIPLPHKLLLKLKEVKKKSRSTFVVSNGSKTILVRSYQKSFSLILKRLNLAHRGFHSLRHTFATRAMECGMDVKTLSEILGHKNPTVTLNRYVHSFLEHKKEMMNKIGDLL